MAFKLSRFMLLIWLWVPGLSAAGNGIDSGKIAYQAFPEGRPRSVTVISGQVIKNLRLFGGVLRQGVAWEDQQGQSREHFRQQICRLANERCLPFNKHGVRVGELFLGAPETFNPPVVGGPGVIGIDSLTEVGFGAKRVLLLSVEDMTQVMQSITIVFDSQVTDEQLRQMALEDGVYRVLRYRDEE